MSQLILMRHGQSEWNKHNLFTGWVDVPLSSKGIEEALEGGRKIKDVPIDVIFTSTLIRAHTTLVLAMSVHSEGKVPVFQHTGEGQLEEWGTIHSEVSKKNTIPVIRAWELNERMYGDLQGVNKTELAEKYGAEQVKIWRRSYDIPPPNGESLKDTANRAIPYFKDVIVPYLAAGKNVFISAHGNSLRAIVMVLDKLSEEEIINLEIPTGKPFSYYFENGNYTKLI